MADPIERPWNHERDAKREQVARQVQVRKAKCWITFAIVLVFGSALGIYAAANLGNPDPCARADSAQRLAELHFEDGLIGPAIEALDEASRWRKKCILQD